MKTELLKEKYIKYNLTKDDIFKHQHWYVMEMAEKRAMSRAVLKLTGFYELGVFGEDESESFKKQ